jgi:hypothetical protein
VLTLGDAPAPANGRGRRNAPTHAGNAA